MGFSANSLGRLNIEIGYSIDQTGLNQIKQSLQDISALATQVNPGTKMSEGFKQAQASAKQLGSILSASINANTGALDMTRFATNMKMAGASLQGMQSSFAAAGAEGQAAFSNINSQLLKTQTSVTKTEGAVGQLRKTFVNTFLYSFSYRIVGSFIKGISDALSYVKDLDKALTDISIVTKDSSEQMQQFASHANKAAKDLGVSTKEYTKAALIFTQQGLKGKERDVKTETTMKVANVTGDDAAEVSQNLTAVWNGYRVNSEEAEAAIDKLANVAAHSASNLAELSTGMSKVASAANTMGVSEDQLVSQLSTIESVTRQAPESIGTALKTIYARMGDLKVEGTDEFGVSLGEVSSKLKTMGIDILDQEGNMKEMGTVIEEVAGKWDTWTKAQQQAAAIAMAGKRQYNNLISLFSNWDMYEQNMEYSQNSEGEIEAQQQIYLQSIEGLKEKAAASWEAVYSNLFDADHLKNFYKIVAGIGDSIGNMGSFVPVAAFSLLGTILQGKIVPSLTNVVLGLTQAQQQANLMKLAEDNIAAAMQGCVYLSGTQVGLAKDLSGSEKTRVLTNEEIYNAQIASNGAITQSLQKVILAKREELSLAESKKELLAIQEFLTTEEQATYQMIAEENSMLEKQTAEAQLNLGTTVARLGIEQERITTAMTGENAEAETAKILQGQLMYAENILTAKEELMSVGFSEKELNNNILTTMEMILDLTENRTEAEVILQQALKMSDGTLNGIIQAVEKILRDSNQIINTFTTTKAAIEQNALAMHQMGVKAAAVARTTKLFSGFTSAIFGVGMLASSLKSLFDTIKDPKTSGLEKITSILMSFGMIAMSVKQLTGAFSAFKVAAAAFKMESAGIAVVQNTLGNSLDSSTRKTIANNLSVDLSTKKKKENAIETIKQILIGKGYKASEAEQTAATMVNTAAEKYNTMTKMQAIKVQLVKIATNIAEFASAHPLALVIGAITIALIALVVAYVNSTSAQEKHAKALTNSHKKLTEERDLLSETKKRYEELRESIINLESAYGKLANLTQGTKEWKEQVIEVNNQVLELMKNYPELAKYITKEDGALHISEEGLNMVLDNTASAVQSQESSVLVSQAETTQNKKIEALDAITEERRGQYNYADEALSMSIFGGLSGRNLIKDSLNSWYSQQIEDMANSDKINSVEDVKQSFENSAVGKLTNGVSSFVEYFSKNRDETLDVAVVKGYGLIAESLKNAFIPNEEKELNSIYNKIEEIRVLNQQHLEELKQAGAAQREALDIQFTSQEKDPEKREQEIEGKNTAYDIAFAQTMKKAQQNDEIINMRIPFISDFLYENNIPTPLAGVEISKTLKEKKYDFVPDFFFNNTGEYRSFNNSDDDADYWGELAATYNIYEGADVDEDVIGINRNTKVNQSELMTAIEEMLGRGLTPAQATYIEENYRTSKDISTLHWLSKQSGIDENSLKWDEEQNAVVDLQGNIIRQFQNVAEAARYGEQKILEEVIGQIDYESFNKLNTQEAGFFQNAGITDIFSFNIGQLTKETIKNGITFDLQNALEKAGFDDDEIEDLEDKTQLAYDNIYKTLSKGAQKLLDSDLGFSVQQAKEADKYLIYEERLNKQRKQNEEANTVISDLYKQNSDNVEDVQNVLSSIDWSKDLSVDELKGKIVDLDAEINFSDENFKKLIQTMKDCSVGVSDLNTNMETLVGGMHSYVQKLQDLKPGDDLTPEEYESLLGQAFNPDEFKKLFYYDPKKNKYIAKESSTPDKDFDQLKQESFLGSFEERVKDIDKRRQLFAEQSNKEGKKIQEYSAEDWGKEEEDHKETAKNIIQNSTNEQLEYLRNTQGGKYQKLIDDYILTGEEIPDAFKQIMSDLTESLRQMGTDAVTGALDPSSNAYLQERLQVENTTVEEIYGDAITNANQKSGKVQEATTDATEAVGSDLAIALGDTQQSFANFEKQVLNTNGALKGCSDALQNVASTNLYGMYQLTKKMSELWNDTYAGAKEGTAEWANLTQESISAIKKVYDVDVDQNWIKKNKGLIQKWTNGDKEAYKQIEIKLAKRFAAKKFSINFNDKKFNQQFTSLMKKLQKHKIQVGAVLKSDVIKKQMLEVVRSMKLGAEEASQYIAQFWNYAAKFKNGENGLEFDGDVRFIGDQDDVDISNAADAGKGNDKGSDSGNDKPNYTYEEIDKNDIDHLHDLKQAMEDLNSTLSKLKNEQDKVFGKSLIANLNKQNNLIEKQNKNLKDQIKIQTKDLGQSQTDMRKLFGFRFNKKTGRISNYKKVLNERYHAYKNYLEKYNSLSAKQQEAKKGQLLKAKADKAKTQWSEAKTAVSDYDTLFNERQQNIDKTIENFNTIAENNIKKLHAMAEALELTTQLQETYLNYQKDINHDSKDRAYQSAYNIETAKLEQKRAKENLKETQALNKELAKMTKTGWSKKYGTNFKALTEALVKSQKALVENIKKAQDSLISNIQLLTDNYKDFNEEVERTNKAYKHLISTLETYNEITKMLYGEDEYDVQSEVALEKVDLYKGQTEVAKRNFEEAQQYLSNAEQAYKDALDSGSKEGILKAKETLDAAKEAVNNAEEALNEAIKNQIKSLQEWYTAQIKEFFKDLEKVTTGGYGWDFLSTSIKRAKQYSDDWLDDIQRIGNISQLNASFEQELAKAANSSASAQQKILQCKQEQLAALEKIDKLTQYDIDRAKTKLSLTLKQIALEEARENKSKLRLKRDSQGNYSYQYSADREAIEKAKEEYEQARLKLNEDDQKNLQNAIDKMASLEKEAQESLSKLYEDLSKARTQEEKDRIQREFNQTLDYYDRQRRNRKQDVDRARTYLEGSDSGLGYYNQKMGTNYGSAKEAINKDKDGFYEFLYGSEGAVPLTDAAYQMMNQSTDDWRKEVKKAVEKGETAYEKYSSSVSDIANSVNGSLRSIIEGTSNHTGLINTKKYTDELNKSVENSAEKYRKANKAISTNIKRSGKLFKTLNSEAAKQAIKKPAQLANHLVNAKANVQALYNYINDNKSLAIDPMKEMSENAKTLKKNWEGVYRAAKKAINAAKDGGSGGGTETPTTNPTGDSNGRKAVKYKGATLYKKGKKYYTAASGGKGYSSKKKAYQMLQLGHINKIGNEDIGRKISLNPAGLQASVANPYGHIKSYTWDKKNKKWKVLHGSNTLLTISKKNNYIKKISSSGGKVLLGSKKGKNLGWFNVKTIQKYFQGFDTGGYTGSWNNTKGKLAMLHEKEIVLNKKDTANFLEAVKLTRSFAQDLGKYKNNLANQISALSNNTKVINNQDNLQRLMQQEVNINATFPNATDRTEIEAAFKQLSDKAIQYAWSDKIK